MKPVLKVKKSKSLITAIQTVSALAIRIMRFEIVANRWRFEALRTANCDSRHLSRGLSVRKKIISALHSWLARVHSCSPSHHGPSSFHSKTSFKIQFSAPGGLTCVFCKFVMLGGGAYRGGFRKKEPKRALCFRVSRLFIILFVHNFRRVCSQFSESVRNSVRGPFNPDSRGNPSLGWLGEGRGKEVPKE